MLKDQKFIENDKIEPIFTASVPVIKIQIDYEKLLEDDPELLENFRDFKKSSQYKNFKFNHDELNYVRIDLTFVHFDKTQETEKMNSVMYAKIMIEQFPEVKIILKVIKRFFLIKQMNNCFSGGLSSFNLFLLILSYAQTQEENSNHSNSGTGSVDSERANINLGYFLNYLVGYFGHFFNFRATIIDTNAI